MMTFNARRRHARSIVAVSALVVVVSALVVVVVTQGPAIAIAASGRVGFTDIAVAGSSLAQYRRAPSPEYQRREANRHRSPITAADFIAEPVHDRGLPGVVLFDYDNDGDTDIFVTNGPGRPKSLYQNQLQQTGRATFVDVASAASASLTAMDANGACAGDLDNDGKPDLYVLGRNEPDHLLRNLGNGTFQDATISSGSGAGSYNHTSCTMADFDGDGLLDIAIANTFDMKTGMAIVAVPYDLNQPNQLLHNTGHMTFADVTASSGFGLIDVGGRPAPLGDISWAIAAVDIDQDGDADIITANDQGAFPMRKYGGVDRGYIRVHKNDGKGHFTDVTHQLGLDEPGAWMGLAFGDFNFDGTLDIFSTNFGDYVMMNPPLPTITQDLGDWSSRWLLQQPDGKFVDPRRSSVRKPVEGAADPSLGGLNATPFGWGESTLDYDNDGSTDIIFHGSLDALSGVTADNPGALLRNQGPRSVRNGFFPTFTYDNAFTRSGADHRHRTVTGVATGDLDHNGFVDVVSVASSRSAGDLTPYQSIVQFNFHSPFDDASFLEVYQHVGSRASVDYTPTGKHTVDGDLAVEMNSGGNGNRSASVRTIGSVGLSPRGRVNRDGVGAVVKFTPAGGPTAIRPVVAGSSFASQDELEGTFGMGHADVGTVEVLWPGGTRNKLYEVRAGERISFPEIPCNYSDKTTSSNEYRACVDRSLHDLVAAGKLTQQQADRFSRSAVRAFNEAR
jgi:hypothetical protein